MKNQYISAQCKNMVSVLITFTEACELAALEDDGVMSCAEEKSLWKLRTAAKRFQKELEEIIYEMK